MPSSSNYMAYSDASRSGCGAHLDLNGEQTCHKLWDQHEITKSSTMRELSAIEFALKKKKKKIPTSDYKYIFEMVH